MSATDYAALVLDRYAEGDAAGMLEVEYRQVVELAARFTERSARQRPAPDLPTAVEIISALAVEQLPHGPAPSLSDALHALDRVYGAWQGESAAFQRIQARALAFALGQLSVLLRLVR